MKTVCGFLAVILTIISIVASSGYFINETNKTANKQIYSSKQYNQLEQSKELQVDTYNVKKAELERLQQLQSQTRIDGQKAVDSLPKDYITAKNNTRIEYQQKVDNIQQQINAASSELSQLSADAQSPINIDNVEFKSENGYMAIFSFVAELINKVENKNVSPDTIKVYFFLFVSAIFEILAVTLFVIQKKVLSIIGFMISFAFTLLLMTSMSIGLLSIILMGAMALVLDLSKIQLLLYSTGEVALNGNNFKSFKTPKFMQKKNTKTPVTARAKIGFDTSKKKPKAHVLKGSHDSHDTNIFYDCMKKNAINNIVQKGYLKIGKEIGFSNGKSRSAYENLKAIGKIKAEGGKTIII